MNKVISVVIPAYKEAENLRNILPRLNTVLSKIPGDHEVLVVDTIERTDDTKEVCETNNVTHLIRKGGNQYGDAIRTGFEAAQGRFTVVMDADGSHDPRTIIRMFKIMIKGRYDLVIGSRYCKGGYTENNAILRFMSWILNVTYRVVFGLKIKDISDSFRMYQTDQLKDLVFECNNFDIVEEILILLYFRNKHFRIKEIPIRFNQRAAGESKRDLLRFIFSYVNTMKRLFRIMIRAKRKFKETNEEKNK